MGDGSNGSEQRQMNLGQRLATARASAAEQKLGLRDKLYPREHGDTLVSSVESDGWLVQESAPARQHAGAQVTEKWAPRFTGPLTAYVSRACEIGRAMGHQRGRARDYGALREAVRPHATAPAHAAAAPASAVALTAARAADQTGNNRQPTLAPAERSPRRVSSPPPPPPPRRSRLGEGLPYLDALPTPGPTPPGNNGGRPPRWHSAAVPGQPPPGGSRHASRTEQDQQLRQAQSRLHEALAHAHKQQLLKAEAQLRARHAEQWLAEYSQRRATQPPAPRFRIPRNASAVLVFCITAFIVGGYISLLVPMRKRVLMQEAALHRLDESHQYLTRQNEALMQQLAGQPAVEAP